MHYYCYILCHFTCKSMQCNAINFTNYILYRWSFFDLDLLLPFYRSAFIHWWILSTLSNAAVTREQPSYEINKIYPLLPAQSQQSCQTWGWITTAAQTAWRLPGAHLEVAWITTCSLCRLWDRPRRSAACLPTSHRRSSRVWHLDAAMSSASRQ